MQIRSNLLAAIIVFVLLPGCTTQPRQTTVAEKDSKTATHTGFFDLFWDEKKGKLLLSIEAVGVPFIYQTSLARGVGSNDIGLDRGQLGSTKLVEFFRSGPKMLLVENNTSFRADSDNKDERQAVKESFAQSVLWGFVIEDTQGASVIVDATDFFLRDSHGLGSRLKEMDQGSFSVDKSRSVVYLPRTKSFPDNTEIETVLTLTGAAKGNILPTVVPDQTAITVHTHHSFVRLPEDSYQALPYDPRSGFIDTDYLGGYLDFAASIDKPLVKSFARRHRLKKKRPNAAMSEPIKPIVYYLDRGAPEPIRSALLEGARWWNQAFEAAGYKDAFRVELLPIGADPLDVRYNVIQWVHRSTRGWSYGASVVDPRTGEIIKGHVSLGSLRVRQDFLLAEGLLAPYVSDEAGSGEMETFALARIRQLSAHEVGHTLGLEHNFAASMNNRASVMDYPFPLIRLTDQNEIDLSDAYAVGIGAWDKRAILWGYQDFPEAVDTQLARQQIIKDTFDDGLLFVANNDARSIGSAHAQGSLWDNGGDPVVELEHLLRVRSYALGNFSEANIQSGRPLATLEEVLVPMYLLHRFQIQAVGKLLGGSVFTYNLKGGPQKSPSAVKQIDQLRALNGLLATLSVSQLVLPERVLALISPRPPGFAKGRETFAGDTGKIFDPYAPADAAIGLTLDVLLEPSRGARLIANKTRNGKSLGFSDVLDKLMSISWEASRKTGTEGEIQRRLNNQIILRLGVLANGESVPANVRSLAWAKLDYLLGKIAQIDSGQSGQLGQDALWRAHDLFALAQLKNLLEKPQDLKLIRKPKAPPGSPIGQ